MHVRRRAVRDKGDDKGHDKGGDKGDNKGHDKGGDKVDDKGGTTQDLGVVCGRHGTCVACFIELTALGTGTNAGLPKGRFQYTRTARLDPQSG